MIRKIDHIGIAVRDVEKAARFYTEQLGIAAGEVVVMAGGNVKIMFLPIGEIFLELIEARDPEESIAHFIEKNGEGLHHLCLDVVDIQAEVNRLDQQGVPFVDKEPKQGARAIGAFLHPKAADGVIIQLSQLT